MKQQPDNVFGATRRPEMVTDRRYCTSTQADKVLYPYCKKEFRAADYRLQVVAREIRGYGADVIMLQVMRLLLLLFWSYLSLKNKNKIAVCTSTFFTGTGVPTDIAHSSHAPLVREHEE